MKKLFALFGLAWLALTAQAALPQPDLIAQIYFAGPQKISPGIHTAAFTNEFCSPEAAALQTQTTAKLATWLAGWLQTNLNVSVPDGPAKLSAVLSDLEHSEWYLESRTGPDGKPVVGIAIKIAMTKAQTWESGLKPFFTGATFKTANGWLIFDSDPARLKLADHLTQATTSQAVGAINMDINWPHLAQWYPALSKLALPETHFTITIPDNDFRIDGKFVYPEPLALKLEPWKLPTNTIHMPFNTLMAVRGFGSWLQSQKWAQSFQFTPALNQLFVWSQPFSPFQTFAATPVPNASNALSQTYAQLLPMLKSANANHVFATPVSAAMAENTVQIRGMPFVTPSWQAVTEPAGDYLFLGLFANTPSGKPLPDQILHQFSNTNAVYLQWENTAPRMPQLLNETQFGLMITTHRQLTGKSAAMEWLQKTGPALGNTETEIDRTGPAELIFVRKAPGIFTAAELYLLANWLEMPHFPAWDLTIPSTPAGTYVPPQSRSLPPGFSPQPVPAH